VVHEESFLVSVSTCHTQPVPCSADNEDGNTLSGWCSVLPLLGTRSGRTPHQPLPTHPPDKVVWCSSITCTVQMTPSLWDRQFQLVPVSTGCWTIRLGYLQCTFYGRWPMLWTAGKPRQQLQTMGAPQSELLPMGIEVKQI
jgi:hypothetical protein